MKYSLVINENNIKDNSNVKIGKNCMIYMDYINNNFIIPIDKVNSLYYLKNNNVNEDDSLLKLSWNNI